MGVVAPSHRSCSSVHKARIARCRRSPRLTRGGSRSVCGRRVASASVHGPELCAPAVRADRVTSVVHLIVRAHARVGSIIFSHVEVRPVLWKHDLVFCVRVDDVPAASTAAERPYCASMVCLCDLFGIAIGALVDAFCNQWCPVRIGVWVVIVASTHASVAIPNDAQRATVGGIGARRCHNVHGAVCCGRWHAAPMPITRACSYRNISIIPSGLVRWLTWI